MNSKQNEAAQEVFNVAFYKGEIVGIGPAMNVYFPGAQELTASPKK